MMNRYIKYLLLSVPAVLLTSCEGDRYDLSTMIPEKYHTVLSFADTQIKENILYEDINNSISFKVLKGGSELNTACSATLHILSNEELHEQYGNAYTAIPQSMYSVSSDLLFPPEKESGDVEITFDENQVDKLKEFYTDLPEGIKPCIAVKVVPYKGTTVFDGNDIAISTFSIRKIELMAGCSGGKMSLSGLNDLSSLPMANINAANSISISMPTNVSNQWEILCTAKYRPDLIEAYNAENGTLSTSMLSLDSELFYILAANTVSLTESNFSSPATATYDGSGLAGLCDNTSGFWHSVYKDEPGNPEVGPYYYDDTFGHYFQVRLNTPLEESFRLAYWVRADYDPTASAPSEVRLYYSNSAQPEEETETENGWKLLTTLTKDEDNLPATSGAFYLSGPIDLSETGQIMNLRFCVISSNGGLSHPGKEVGAHTAIAEFKLWGK